MRGRGPYRSVWNAMMLSEPDNEVANGCVAGYLIIGEATSTHTTNHQESPLTVQGPL